MIKTLFLGALLIGLTVLIPGCVGPGYYSASYDSGYCGPGPVYGPPVVVGPPAIVVQPYPRYYGGGHGHWHRW